MQAMTQAIMQAAIGAATAVVQSMSAATETGADIRQKGMASKMEPRLHGSS